jgi:hypothetical protein
VLCGSADLHARGPHARHPRAHVRGGHHHLHGHARHAHASRHFHVYHGKHNHPWTQTRADARYGGTIYLSPTAPIWYYYAPFDNCYYPTSYWPKGVYAPSN